MGEGFNIEYISKLARLDLDEKEKGVFSNQLKRIIEYVEKLNQVNTEGVEPTAHTLEITNVWREDMVVQSIDTKLIEKFIIEGKEGFFKVPPVIE